MGQGQHKLKKNDLKTLIENTHCKTIKLFKPS